MLLYQVSQSAAPHRILKIDGDKQVWIRVDKIRQRPDGCSKGVKMSGNVQIASDSLGCWPPCSAKRSTETKLKIPAHLQRTSRLARNVPLSLFALSWTESGGWPRA